MTGANETGGSAVRSETVALSDRWTIVDGRPLFYRVATEAAPPGAIPIVYIHGFGISGRYLVPTAERLAPFYPAYVPDLPGYGRSHKPERTLTIPELAEALASFLDAVEVERAVLLGNSMGCLVAVEFAHAYPERIERAVLVSAMGGPNHQPLYRSLPQLARDSLREPPKLITIAVPDYLRFGPVNGLRLYRAMTSYPMVERALGLELPILWVIGGRDPLVSREWMGELAERKPNLTLVYYNQAAHAINISHPQELAEVVRAYLEDEPIVVNGAEPGEIAVLGRESVDLAAEPATAAIAEAKV
jgi:pimeloyl-ACP methyl ester carboxylesterase